MTVWNWRIRVAATPVLPVQSLLDFAKGTMTGLPSITIDVTPPDTVVSTETSLPTPNVTPL